MAIFTQVEVRPHRGDPYVVKATATKYAIEQNKENPILHESIRFRFDIDKYTALLGDSVVFDSKLWVLGHAQVFHSANRIVVDGSRQSLDTSRCQLADIMYWKTKYDCDAGEDLTLLESDVNVAVMQDEILSLDLNSSRQRVGNFRVYLCPEYARDLSHLNVIRIDDLDLKVKSVHNVDKPGELAWAMVQDYNLQMAQYG